MKNFLHALLLSTLALALSNAHGHGISDPQHGGIVEAGGDMSIELVNGEGQIDIYVMNDDAGAATENMSGKIKVDTGEEKYEVALEPAGDNALVAKTGRLPQGSQAFVIITLPNGYSKVAAKFEIE